MSAGEIIRVTSRRIRKAGFIWLILESVLASRSHCTSVAWREPETEGCCDMGRSRGNTIPEPTRGRRQHPHGVAGAEGRTWRYGTLEDMRVLGRSLWAASRRPCESLLLPVQSSIEERRSSQTSHGFPGVSP